MHVMRSITLKMTFPHYDKPAERWGEFRSLRNARCLLIKVSSKLDNILSDMLHNHAYKDILALTRMYNL